MKRYEGACGEYVYWVHWWWISLYLECPVLDEMRGKYINTKYWKTPNVLKKFSEFITNHNSKSLRKLCVFISNIFDSVCFPSLFSCLDPLYESLTWVLILLYVPYYFYLFPSWLCIPSTICIFVYIVGMFLLYQIIWFAWINWTLSNRNDTIRDNDSNLL